MRRIRKLGQCFLSNPRILDMETFVVSPSGKRIVEIGAGDGRLTERLARTAAHVYAIEKDLWYVNFLREKFSGYVNVEIISSDFLHVRPFETDVIVGNIPYYISSQVIFRLLDWDFSCAFLMFQREFAQKLTARGKDRSRISFFADYYFTIDKVFEVPRHMFIPRPRVDSMLVSITKRNVPPLDQRVASIITYMFQHKLKTIASLLNHMQKDGIISHFVVPDKLPMDKHLLELENSEILKIGKEISHYMA
ncbi:MAG: 16S rRNA (adenine(1518)-N(6)/adenine(1519)-N(6))-dimethyltransferase RsmA [Candidatus Micrarchaeia archaeon]